MSKSHSDFTYAHEGICLSSHSILTIDGVGGKLVKQTPEVLGTCGMSWISCDSSVNLTPRKLLLTHSTLWWKTVTACIVWWHCPVLSILFPLYSSRDTGWGPVRIKSPNSKLHSWSCGLWNPSQMATTAVNSAALELHPRSRDLSREVVVKHLCQKTAHLCIQLGTFKPSPIFISVLWLLSIIQKWNILTFK